MSTSPVIGAVSWFGDAANWEGPRGVPTLLWEHVALTLASLGLACAIGLPLAIWLGHIGRGGFFAIQISNIGRAVPTLALLIVLILMPAPFGFTRISAVTAFTLFALPAIVTNTYIGMREVDRGAVDAARGMGMSGWQVLHRVELPLATPLLMNGVRLAAVQVVATVSIAALASFGGLGRIVVTGFSNRDTPAVIAGAMIIAVLAIACEVLFAAIGRRVDPQRSAVKSARQRGNPVTTVPAIHATGAGGSA